MKKLLVTIAMLLAFATSAIAAGEIDINTATPTQLQTIKGLGPVYINKIIAGRPYTSSAQIVKAGVPAATYAKIKNQIVAKKLK